MSTTVPITQTLYEILNIAQSQNCGFFQNFHQLTSAVLNCDMKYSLSIIILQLHGIVRYPVIEFLVFGLQGNVRLSICSLPLRKRSQVLEERVSRILVRVGSYRIPCTGGCVGRVGGVRTGTGGRRGTRGGLVEA